MDGDDLLKGKVRGKFLRLFPEGCTLLWAVYAVEANTDGGSVSKNIYGVTVNDADDLAGELVSRRGDTEQKEKQG